jgi:hypothetical protein
MIRQTNKWLFGTAALALISTTGMAMAQPDPNNAPKGDNPQNWERGGGQNWRNMTPEQRAAAQQQARRRMLAFFMNASEITDPATQEAIQVFAEAHEKAQTTLREKYGKLAEALAAKAMNKPAVTDAEIETLLAEFRAEVQDEKARRETAIAALEAQTGFSKKPRVELFLTMGGYIGDEATVALGINGIAQLAQAGNRGGGQGGFGNIFGGQGGQGGQGNRGGGNNNRGGNGNNNNRGGNANGNNNRGGNGADNNNPAGQGAGQGGFGALGNNGGNGGDQPAPAQPAPAQPVE